jgi:endo-1,4-beta-xylanase
MTHHHRYVGPLHTGEPVLSVRRFAAICRIVLGLALAFACLRPVEGQTVPSGGVALVAAADLAVQGSFRAGATTGGAVAARTIVAVTGQPFAQAARIDVQRPTGEFWASAISAPSTQALNAGDIVLVRLRLRAVQTTDESGSVFCQVFAEGPAPDYAKSISQQVSAGLEWTEYFLPFTMGGTYPAGQFTFNLGFGASARPQVLEIGGVEVLGYGKTRTLAEMPRTRFTYEGREPWAAWRAAAAERIERLRKATYAVRVVNGAGQPVADARVRVRLERHAFEFGTAFPAARIVNQTTADNRTFRAKLLELFSAGSPENDLKWPPWEGDWGSGYARTQTLAALADLHRQGLALRGHVLVWPSSRNLPNSITALLPTRDPAVPGKVLAHIDDIVPATREWLGEWDVLNEPYDNHELMDLYGEGVMADWFRRARERHPTARLYINDYGILSGGGLNAAKQAHYETTIRKILAAGAPVDGIGFQGHFEGSPTGLTRVWSLLERYANAFPAQVFKITEFDLDTEDEELQADYTRDFLTLIFSHPKAAGFQVWGFWEGAHWKPRAAMYRRDWTEKPNGRAFREQVNGAWRTDEARVTGAEGRVAGRGFLGAYAVEVELGGRTTRVALVLPASGAEVSVVVDATVDPAPRILRQPLGATVAPGEPAVLRVAVAGSPTPVISWERDGRPVGRGGEVLELKPELGPVEGRYVAVATNVYGTVRSRTAQVGVRTGSRVPAILINLSARGRVGAGEGVMIAGFAVEGGGSEAVVLRAVGPRLADFGVPETLPDPRLRLFAAGAGAVLAENDTWPASLAARFSELGAFSLGADARSAALAVSLAPGGYTAQMDGADGRGGVGLLEVYGPAAGGRGQLRNLSVRGLAGAGASVLIAGLVVSGDLPVGVLLRGVGPGLRPFGVSGVVEDPILRLFEATAGGGASLVAVSDDWGIEDGAVAVQAGAARSGAFPLAIFSRDSALAVTLEPGAYTVHLEGSGAQSGIALLEAYALPP